MSGATRDLANGVPTLVCVMAAGSARTGDGVARFTSGPKATAEQAGVKIDFAVYRPTDVAVEILDANGETEAASRGGTPRRERARSR